MKDREGCLADARAGLAHLHSLGFVHIDINPSNIMLDHQGDAVIIDFDSCTPVGASLENVGRTWPWYDEGLMIAVPESDLQALDEVAEWMIEKEEKDYKFGVEW